MDWKLLLADLKTIGKLSQPQIAAVCGSSQATISDIARGLTEDPRHSLGEALRALHARVMAEQAVEAAATEPTAEGQGA